MCDNMPEYVAEDIGLRRRTRRTVKMIRMFYFVHGPFAFLAPVAVLSLATLPFLGMGDLLLPLSILAVLFLAYCFYKIKQKRNPLWEF